MKKVPVIPADHWFFRNSLQVLKDPLGFFEKTFKAYGDIYDVNSNLYSIYVLANPVHAHEVLTTHVKKFKKSDQYQVLKHSLGNGLLISEGDFWRKQRRIAMPAFHKKQLQKLLDTMVVDTQNMVNDWQEKKQVEVHREMMFLTLEIVTNSLFASEIKGDAEKIQEAVTVGNEFLSKKIMTPFSLPIWVPTKDARHYKKTRAYSNEVVDRIISDRRKDPKEYQDLLTMLMNARDEETGEGMSNKQLRDEAMTIFVAGHETTANALSWVLYLLAKHPEKQAKLKEELATILQGKSPNMMNIRQLIYTQQVIEEAMRLYPPAWSIPREATEDVLLEDGYTIPKGTMVVMDIYMAHRHPDFWEKPTEFIPERFAPEAKKKRDKRAYLPFGAGQRICIGLNFAMMEMQIVLAMLLQTYTVQLPVNSQEIEPEALVTLRPKTDILLDLTQD